MLLEPLEKEINGKKFIISKFPALAGREIVGTYTLSGLPKLGDYKLNETIVLKMMGYVGVPNEAGMPLILTTQALVDNHVKDWEMLVRLEDEMMKYNCSFFRDGRASSFLDGVAQIAKIWNSPMWTNSLDQSSPAEKPLSTS